MRSAFPPARPSTLRVVRAAGLLACVGVAPGVAAQQPPRFGERCNVQVGNRVAPVDPEGNWRVNDVSASGNRQRARLVCEGVLNTTTGVSDLQQVVPNRLTIYPRIAFNGSSQGPTRIALAGVTATLTEPTPVQLTVTGTFAAGATQDLTADSTGTDYRVTDSSVATISAGGLLTPLRSGNVLVTAINEAISGSLLVRIAIGGDADGDGLPDDWERAHGLSPNDPTDALTDNDADNLVNRDEFDAGTHPFLKDTDGDGIEDQEELLMGTDGFQTSPLLTDTDGDLIPDALEILVGTSPVDIADYSLDLSLEELRVTPRQVLIQTNFLLDDTPVQLRVTGVLIGGIGIDLTNHSAARYTSLSSSVAIIGPGVGQVSGTGIGSTTVNVSLVNTRFLVPVPVTHQRIQPSVLGALDLSPCGSPNVAVFQDHAYVTCQSGRLDIVSLPPRSELLRVGTVTIAGARDVEVVGTTALVASADGVTVVDVTALDQPTVLGALLLGAGEPGNRIAVDGELAAVVTGGATYVLDVAQPRAPLARGTLAGGGTDVDIRGTLVAVGQGSTVRLLDVTDPDAPAQRSTVGVPVAGLAFVNAGLVVAAGWNDGPRMIDVADPSAPVLKPSTLSGSMRLMDVDGVADLAFGADIFRFNSVPVINVANLDNPVFAFDLDFRNFGDPNGEAVGADVRHVAMVAGNKLHAGLYGVQADNGGIPPVCRMLNPEGTDPFIEGMPLDIIVAAQDDVMVANVRVELDDVVLGTASSGPFTIPWVVPPADGRLRTLRATASDLAGNEGYCEPILFTSMVDPLTTVTGRVVSASMVPLLGASITLSPPATATTAADGTFTMSGLPTYQLMRIVARVQQAGVWYQRILEGVIPVEGGITDVGTIIMDRTADYPTRMGPVAAQSVSYDALTGSRAQRPVTMGPIVAVGVSYDALVGLSAPRPTTMGPVMALSVSYDAMVGISSAGPTVMGPVAAMAVSYDAFPGVSAAGPVLMGPVAAPAVSYDAFPTLGTPTQLGPVAAPTVSYDAP